MCVCLFAHWFCIVFMDSVCICIVFFVVGLELGVCVVILHSELALCLVVLFVS